jgi:hypothetical protein
MLKIFLTMIIFVPTVMAQSFQLKKPVVCDDTALVFQALTEQAGERPIWVGKGDGIDTSGTTLLVNEITKTWTLVQFDKDKACVLGSGISSRPIYTGPEI